MRTIYRIARVELCSLFYSPVAWLVLIIFTFQSGMSFADLLTGQVRTQEMGLELHDLTFYVFLNTMFGFFKEVVGNLYLYVPLLTMGLMSREISSGSIRLLLSSPVRIREIILGKFLAMMIYCGLLMIVLLLAMFIGRGTIEHLDFKALFSGLLGIYLLICAYSAIGLFMSSITSYQVVAAIGTLAALAALNYIREVGQGNEIMRQIAYFLSLSGRTDTFISGLISSRDLLYFLIVITFFLVLAAMKLNDGRTLRSGLVKTGRYLALIVVILSIGYLSSRPAFTGYYDMTVNKIRTLTPNSQEITRQIKKSVQVTAYINMLDHRYWRMRPERRNDDVDYWEQFVRFLPDMRFKYAYYYDSSDDKYLFKRNVGRSLSQVAKRVADSWGDEMDQFLTPAQIKQQIDLTDEEHRTIRQAVLGDKRTFLRMYDEPNPNPGEQEIDAGLKRLLVTPPRVLFLRGEYERKLNGIGDEAYRSATIGLGSRHALINQGFDVLQIDSLDGHEIPNDLTTLVIIDPRVKFKPAELEKIHNYLKAGGNMLIAGEPGKQGLLNPLLEQLGVRMMDGVLIRQSKEYAPDYVQAYYAVSAGKTAQRFSRLQEDSIKVIMPGAAGLEYKDTGDYTITPLVVSNENDTWNKLGSFAMDTGKVTYNPEHGDLRRSIPLALALTRKIGSRQQRIIVLGDADFMSNRLYPDPLGYPGNYALGEESFRWLSYGAFPIDVTRPETKDKQMKIGRDQLSLIRILFTYILPVLILAAGIILLIRRKRK